MFPVHKDNYSGTSIIQQLQVEMRLTLNWLVSQSTRKRWNRVSSEKIGTLDAHCVDKPVNETAIVIEKQQLLTRTRVKIAQWEDSPWNGA